MLKWVIDTQGYALTELDTVGASDTELEERVVDYLRRNPGATTNAVWAGVKGTNSRIRALLDGERFDCVEGKRGALFVVPALEHNCVGKRRADAVRRKPL
jgi:hypothetical protein